MKTALFLSLLALLTLAARPATVQLYHARPAASRLTWTGHAAVGSYAPSGTVQLQAATFRCTGGRLRAAQVTVDMRTLRHDNAQLQEHLCGPDFFDVAHFPQAGFRLQTATAAAATGVLTIRGVSRPVTFPYTLTAGPDGELRLRGTLSLDRTHFGIRYNSPSFFANLGDQAIRNDFQLSFDVPAQAE